MNNENSEWMSAYQDDIEGLWVFVYENKDHYSYYIPTEIKKNNPKRTKFEVEEIEL